VFHLVVSSRHDGRCSLSEMGRWKDERRTALKSGDKRQGCDNV
jgi:hypothetical protein